MIVNNVPVNFKIKKIKNASTFGRMPFFPSYV